MSITAEDPAPTVAHDQSPTPARWWRTRLPLAVLLPVGIYVVLRPEQYGLVPNPLDPVFYTAYAVNFDDVMREVGDAHYIVSRWPVYMPSRLMTELFGPVAGRLLLRWIVATTILLSIWHLGRRWAWNRSTELLIGVIVLTMPMFARSFLTDYVEWVVVAAGFVVVCQCLERRPTIARSAAIGALSAVIVISNPLAALIVAWPCAIYLYRVRSPLARLVAHVVCLAISGLAIVMLGYVAFRWRYGIPNVYRPTLDYMRDNPSTRDPLRSPRNDWMWAFTWIYAPVVVIAGSLSIPVLRQRLRGDRVLLAAMCMLLVQYVAQWFDHVAREGASIEIEYYFTFVTPTLLVASALIIGSVRWSSGGAATLVVAWLAVIVATSGLDVEFPNGWMLIVLAICCLTAVALHRAMAAQLSVGLLLVVTLATQVAAPDYDPTAYHPYNLSAKYDEIFFHPRTDGVQTFREMLWLERTLDQTDDRDLYITGTGLSARIIGLYAPHVSRHLLRHDATGRLDEEARTAIDEGIVSRVLVFGPPEFSKRIAEELVNEAPGGVVEFDRTSDTDLGYEAIIVDVADPSSVPRTWTASELLSNVGTTAGTARVAVPGDIKPDFLAHGPYLALDQGRYRASVTYSSDAPASTIVGTFDVAIAEVPSAIVDLPGTNGHTRTVDFTVDLYEANGWEFRVFWNGQAELTVHSVSSAPLASAT